MEILEQMNKIRILDKIRETVLEEALLRDGDINVLISRAQAEENLASIINGKENQAVHSAQALRLRQMVDELKSKPITYLGQAYCVIGNEVYPAENFIR